MLCLQGGKRALEMLLSLPPLLYHNSPSPPSPCFLTFLQRLVELRRALASTGWQLNERDVVCALGYICLFCPGESPGVITGLPESGPVFMGVRGERSSERRSNEVDEDEVAALVDLLIQRSAELQGSLSTVQLILSLHHASRLDRPLPLSWLLSMQSVSGALSLVPPKISLALHPSQSHRYALSQPFLTFAC
jgi:hypothetical protein